MRSDIVNLIDQVFNADESELSKRSFNDFVGSKRDSLLVDLTVTSLVDHLRDSMSSGISESDKRLNLLDHVKGGSVNSDKGGVVDLSESQQLKDLFDIGSQIVDTSDSDDEENLRFSGNVERTLGSSLSLKVDHLFLLSGVFLVMSFTSLGIFSSLSLGLFLSLLDPSLSGISELGVSGSLLKDGFRDLGVVFFDLH